MRTVRKEQIVLTYVLVTGGRLPENLRELLKAMRRRIGPVTEDEVRRAIKWSLRQSRRSGAMFERRLRAARRDLAANVILLPCRDDPPPAPG